VRHQTKWRVKSANFLITDSWISLSDHTCEEEVTHPINQDRAKAVAWKGKMKEGSNNQHEPSSAVGDMMFTVMKLITSFAKA
jgi:hypothetical protein